MCHDVLCDLRLPPRKASACQLRRRRAVSRFSEDYSARVTSLASRLAGSPRCNLTRHRRREARYLKAMGYMRRACSPVVPPVRVLVSIDGPRSANLLAQLRDLDCHVLAAGDGASTVRQALSFRPDLVLLDLGSPRLNAFDVARAIREHNALDQTKLVAVTAFQHDFYRRRATGAGFYRYLERPCALWRLAEVITSVRQAS